jgi:hypothetical protein
MKIAVVGSGPGAMYTLKYFLKRQQSRTFRVDIFESLSTPYGLVRFGVAPDHSEVKEVSNEFHTMLREHKDILRLHTNHDVIGSSDFNTLRESYDAVLIATGAQSAKRLKLPHLPANTMAARDFVLWYNGHPDFKDQDPPLDSTNVCIVGHGNVALDAARMLSKTPSELDPLASSGLLAPYAYEWLIARQNLPRQRTVEVIGRRGFIEAAFTNKEFRELTCMKDAVCVVNERELEAPLCQLGAMVTGDRAKTRGLSILSKCISTSSSSEAANIIKLRFHCQPLAYEGSPATGLRVRHQDGSEEVLACELGIESIGFQVVEKWGLALDEKTGGIAHDGLGRVKGFPNVYVAGWAKRGPKGVIAANIPCCAQTAEAMVSDLVASRY